MSRTAPQPLGWSAVGLGGTFCLDRVASALASAKIRVFQSLLRITTESDPTVCALPGRVSWTLRPGLTGFTAHMDAACCTPQGLAFQALPRWGGVTLHVADAQTHWPAALLSGLGTPWNTLQPDGELQLSSQGLRIEAVQGRVAVAGTAQIEARNMSSRLSTLRPVAQ